MEKQPQIETGRHKDRQQRGQKDRVWESGRLAKRHSWGERDYRQTQKQTGGRPMQAPGGRNRQSGPVINRRHNRQIGGHSQTHLQTEVWEQTHQPRETRGYRESWRQRNTWRDR